MHWNSLLPLKHYWQTFSFFDYHYIYKRSKQKTQAMINITKLQNRMMPPTRSSYGNMRKHFYFFFFATGATYRTPAFVESTRLMNMRQKAKWGGTSSIMYHNCPRNPGFFSGELVWRRQFVSVVKERDSPLNNTSKSDPNWFLGRRGCIRKLVLDSFHSSNPCSIRCSIGSCHCFIYSIIYMRYLICFMSCMSGLLKTHRFSH